MKQKIISLLKWSEKYTKTDMTYLVKGGFWLLSSQAVLFLFSFILMWVFANLMTQELYGQYRFLVTVIGLLSIATLPGMRTALVRAVARGNSGIIPKIIRTRITWGFLGSLGALIGASYYFYQEDPTLGWLFILIAIFVPFYESFLVFDTYHNGRKDYLHHTTSSITHRFIVVISTVVSIILSSNIFIIFGVYLASTVFSSMAIYYYTIRRFPLSEKTDTETIPYGKQLSVMSIISITANHLDKITLWYLAGPIQVAVYTVATSLPKEIAGAFSQIGILALPKMANKSKSELRQSLLYKTFIFFIASVPVFILYLFTAPTIFSILLPQYIDSIFFSQIAGIFILLTPTTLLFQYFNATMHTKALYIMQFVQPTILIALFFILIPLYGIMGAIIAMLVKQIVGFILMVYFFIKDTRVID